MAALSIQCYIYLMIIKVLKTIKWVSVFLLFSPLLFSSNWRSFLNAKKKQITQFQLNEIGFTESALEEFANFVEPNSIKALLTILLNEKENYKYRQLAKAILAKYSKPDYLNIYQKYKFGVDRYNYLLFELLLELKLVPESNGVWLSLINHKDTRIATRAVNEMSNLSSCSDQLLKSLLKKLNNKDSNFYFKSACIEVLKDIRSSQSLDPLIKLLDSDIYSESAHKTLKDLTAKDFERNRVTWTNWLKQNPTLDLTVEPKIDQKGSGNSDARSNDDEFEERYMKRYGSETNEVQILDQLAEDYERSPEDKSFYGVDVYGQNLFFFLDWSGSMTGKPYEILEREFNYMIDAMGSDYSVGLAFFPFNGRAYLSSKPLTNSNKTKIKRLLKDGRSPKRGALPLAQAMESLYKKKIFTNSRNKIDTIVVLSDGYIGSPSCRFSIHELLISNNIRVDTICIRGSEHFLKPVAEDNYGRFFMVR